MSKRGFKIYHSSGLVGAYTAPDGGSDPSYKFERRIKVDDFYYVDFGSKDLGKKIELVATIPGNTNYWIQCNKRDAEKCRVELMRVALCHAKSLSHLYSH